MMRRRTSEECITELPRYRYQLSDAKTLTQVTGRRAYQTRHHQHLLPRYDTYVIYFTVRRLRFSSLSYRLCLVCQRRRLILAYLS